MRTMTMKRTHGNQEVELTLDIRPVFDRQIKFQNQVLAHRGQKSTLPLDSNYWFMYHMNAMQEELGEVLKADKRWKTHRNVAYDPSNKLEELADVVITALNLSIFSGFTAEDLYSAVVSKIEENFIKLNS